MKKNIIITLFGIGILIFGFATSVAAVPQNINYQGILRDSAGNLQNGTFSMTFKIYNAESGGPSIYTSPATNVPVSNGLYNVELPADASVFDGSPKYLEVKVGTDTLTPRLKINSVSYAIRTEIADYTILAASASSAATASTADTVDGFHATSEASDAADKLYALDSTGTLSNIPVSAKATSGFALFVDGRLGAETGDGFCAGTATIDSGLGYAEITNSAVTSNSIIIVTAVTSSAFNDGGLRVYNINNPSGKFYVTTADGSPSINIPINYLIIN